jgi:hypothetical protein
MNNISHDGFSPNRNSDLRPLELEAGMVTSQPRYSDIIWEFYHFHSFEECCSFNLVKHNLFLYYTYILRLIFSTHWLKVEIVARFLSGLSKIKGVKSDILLY